MPLRFSYIWQGSDEIPILRWLLSKNEYTNNNQLIHVYSMFMNRQFDPDIWRIGKRIFYSGEYIMDENHADVVIRFMPTDDNTNPRYILNMKAPYNVLVSRNNRVGVKYIQLRLQELDAIEYKINQLIMRGIIDTRDNFEGIRDYLLLPDNITPYADMMLSWTRNKPEFNGLKDTIKKKFCLFLVSNPGCRLRNEIFMLLSRVGHVVSAGAYHNNLTPGDARPPDRMKHNEYIEYLRQFRFMITFENKSLPHYHTEKITNAFEAGVIPIYWGDPFITDIYDARSFIHIPTFDNPNQQWDTVKKAVEQVKLAENDPIIYANYFKHLPISIERQKQEDGRVAASLNEIAGLI